MTDDNKQEFFLGWYGKKVATLNYNGAKFGFDYESGWLMPLESYQRTPGELPKYLYNLMPAHVLDSIGPETLRLMASTLGSRERFLANIAVVKDPSLLSEMIHDRLSARLQDFRDADGVFVGDSSADLVMSRETIADIDELIATKRLTQFSGSQTKLSMHLGEDGMLRMATGLPSTHILKYSGFGGDAHNLRGAMEWACMEMAKAGGVNTAEFALLEMPGADGPQLHYLTERFDIPSGPEDGRIIFCEELGGALNLTPRKAAGSQLKDIVPKFRLLSSRPKDDMELLMRQLAANVIMENGDFHSRNLAVLKVANPSLSGWRSVRLSPAYDMMYTRPFSSVPIEEGKRECPRMTCYANGREPGDIIDLFATKNFDGFAVAADLMEISHDRAKELVSKVAAGMEQRALKLREGLPSIFDRHPVQAQAVMEAVDVTADNARELMRSLDPSARMRGPR